MLQASIKSEMRVRWKNLQFQSPFWKKGCRNT